jgi:opacity protein-like surface antigen
MLKKVLLVGFCLLAVVPCFALDVQMSANAGLYTAPGGVGSSTMYGLSATQPLTENVSVRGMFQTTTYSVGSASTTFMPISLDVIYGQSLPGGIRPYAGAGLSYNSTSVSGGSTTQTAGAQALAGLSYNFGPMSAGLEYRYMIPNLNSTGAGSSTFTANISGSMNQSFHF